MNSSPKLQAYFDSLQKYSAKALEIASKAREQGFDPDDQVEIQIAKNMAERVVGLISVIAPQIRGSGADKRIVELEKQYGVLDWRVALQIALEVAQEKFCKFKDKKEAMEVGIRMGFAYGTVGVVSSPLEGFVDLDIKPRRDGEGEYFCINYAGPVRNAGGTAAAWSVIIADYVRKNMGYAQYDPTEDEIKRCATEIADYHERVTNLQYFPSKEETDFLMRHIPVEIGGDASEDIEVSNYKDLPRIATNKIRSGYCLIHSSCIPLKAPKLWKELSKWGADFGLEHWNFLEEFLAVQKKAKAAGAKKDDGKEKPKITPDFTFVKDLVAGRPIIGMPLASGAFRLRYGRSRTSGYSAQCIHPASMFIMDDFIAIGTQLKVERPGKGAAFTPCDTIEGPIVRLKNGRVLRLDTIKQAKEYNKEVEEILYLGDVLINYGDFLNRAHVLAPAGYCEEWWSQEVEKAIVEMFGELNYEKAAELCSIDAQVFESFIRNPLRSKPSVSQALRIAKFLSTPLHPTYTFFFKEISAEQMRQLQHWLALGKHFKEDGVLKKIVCPLGPEKRIAEIAGIPHLKVEQQVVFEEKEATILSQVLLGRQLTQEGKTGLDLLQGGPVIIRDKSGTFIGARMGRPEKAKMRKLTGSPHGLFPIGEEGGRLRSFQAALEAGKVRAEFSLFKDPQTGRETIYRRDEVTGNKTIPLYYDVQTGKITTKKDDKKQQQTYMKKDIDIRHYFNKALEQLGMNTYPDLIKGIRGTSNREHIPEHLTKAILRAKHEIYVNKDGTIRCDASELPCTHFKPKEIGTSVEKLKELGYTHDIKGKPLENDDQILEIFPQDCILPCCPTNPEEPTDKVFIRVCQFIDELLEKVYGLEPFYNVKGREDLVGHLMIALAPHTSAGMVCRIIGFTKSQGFFAHPYLHAAERRDTDGDELGFFMLLDGFLNFSKKFLPGSRGGTMDAPLVLTTILTPAEVDDMAFDVDIVWRYPLELYEAALEYKMPWEVDIKTIKSTINTPDQFENMGFTHDTRDFNEGVLCSAYKTLPSMEEKLKGQMDLAQKIRAVDTTVVAKTVIEKHFLRDIKGNLRKFSSQVFRCVHCNEKYRRPPLRAKCERCGGKIIFTISEGSVVKYLEPSLSLAQAYEVDTYLKQTLDLLKRQVEGVFGRDKEKQLGLGAWFG
ncbi:DNA polymerase II large subunit [Candidatus Woesearchaeota archaeon]|nr:MAG: DNA polymerase II large subunit [Candidatus Woesearchaeota archaeon]